MLQLVKEKNSGTKKVGKFSNYCKNYEKNRTDKQRKITTKNNEILGNK